MCACVEHETTVCCGGTPKFHPAAKGNETSIIVGGGGGPGCYRRNAEGSANRDGSLCIAMIGLVDKPCHPMSGVE